MKRKIYEKSLLAITATAVLSWCWWSSSDSSSGNETLNDNQNINKVNFVDSYVKWVKYIDDYWNEWFTDENWTILYNSKDINNNIKVLLWDVVLFEIKAWEINSDNKVFIQDGLWIDRNDTSNENVVKVATLLQSLDSDWNVSNGIDIDNTSFESYKWNTMDFENHADLITNYDINSTIENIWFQVRNRWDVVNHLDTVYQDIVVSNSGWWNTESQENQDSISTPTLNSIWSTNDTTPTITWNEISWATKYYLSIDWWSWIEVSTNSYTISSELSEWNYSVKIKSADDEWNESEESEEMLFTIDTTVPEGPGEIPDFTADTYTPTYIPRRDADSEKEEYRSKNTWIVYRNLTWLEPWTEVRINSNSLDPRLFVWEDWNATVEMNMDWAPDWEYTFSFLVRDEAWNVSPGRRILQIVDSVVPDNVDFNWTIPSDSNTSYTWLVLSSNEKIKNWSISSSNWWTVSNVSVDSDWNIVFDYTTPDDDNDTLTVNFTDLAWNEVVSVVIV